MKTNEAQLTDIALSDQPLSEEDRELVSTIYSRLDIFEQENRPFHDAAKTARAILRLKDPGQDAPKAKEKTPQLQTLKSTFNNVVADQMQNLPEARLLPETPEMEAVAMELQDAVQHIIYTVNDYAEKVHRRRAEDLYGPGTAITQVVWDPDMSWGEGNIAILRWPVEAFLWDPMAEDIQEARALIKVAWKPMSWFREHYPDAAPYIGADDGGHNHVGLSDIQQDMNGADEPRAMMLEYWYRTYDAKTRRHRIHVAYCAGGALLDHQKDVYMHGMYPFVLDVHSTIEGSPVGDGMVGELTPMMRAINRYARYIDTNLRMASKARMLVRKNSGIDRMALADWSKDFVEGDSVEQGQDWNWLQHAPLNGYIVDHMRYLQTDLKQDSGANQFTRGETTGGVVSAKAISSLQEAGGKITGMRTDTLNAGYKTITEMILWLMAEFYDDGRMVMITGRDGTRKQFQFSREKFFGTKDGSMCPPPYTVRIEINKRDPVQIESQNQMFMQTYTMAAQAKQNFPLSVLLRLMNFDGKDRLIPIVEQAETTQQQMEQLAMQNQQMMEQLAQMQKENDSLKATGQELANAVASMWASGSGMGAQPGAGAQAARAAPRGTVGGAPGQAPTKVAQAGGGPNTPQALVDRARETMAGRPSR